MAPEQWAVLAAVGLPFVAAGGTPLAWRALGERTGYAGSAVSLLCFGLLATQLGREGTVTVPWIPSLDVAVRFHVDGWGLLFALLASGVGALVFWYSAGYMRGESNLQRYYAALLAFMGAILGVALAGDLILLFLFWELTSVCSFVLIGHHTEDSDARSAARMAMVVTVGGGLCLLAGVLLLSLAATAAGTAPFDLVAMLANAEAVHEALVDRGLLVPTLALLGIAAGAKSAQVPLHFWLPGAMVAPTPVSAFLHSATMVKVGVYFFGRIRPILLGPEWTAAVATLGLATMLVGAVLAVAATDIKRLLAYSTASHLGLMVAGFGFHSAAGAEAGTFHLLNHALFKAPLFLVAGIVAHEAGTRSLDELGGLRQDLPITAAVAAVAAVSMAGVPPLGGFYGKEYLFEAAYEAAHSAGGAAWLYPAAAVLASVFTVLYSLRFLAAFFGNRPADLGAVHRPPVAMWGPAAVLAAGVLAVTLAPNLAVDAVVGSALSATAPEVHEFHVSLPTHLKPPVAMSAVALVGGAAAYPWVDRIGDGVTAATGASAAVRPTAWYERGVAGAETGGARAGDWVHNGLLRTYVAWAVGAASALAALGYAATVGTPAIDVALGVPTAVALVLAVALVAGTALPTGISHVAGVLTLSILGFMIAIFYILASAPDLALTQLVVETLLLVVFLLVLEKLPAFYGEARRRVVARDSVLSLVVGATAAATVLLAGREPTADPTALARYYTTEAVPAGGGSNVVNVILVDFRAMDTLGEVIVVAVAAIGVVVLMTMRSRGETQ
jgi:multicomponent Na+:H+ antiporter subunit A